MRPVAQSPICALFLQVLGLLPGLWILYGLQEDPLVSKDPAGEPGASTGGSESFSPVDLEPPQAWHLVGAHSYTPVCASEVVMSWNITTQTLDLPSPEAGGAPE